MKVKKMKENNNNNVTRRTRFQAAPDWSVTESLILVNEVAAVEADCGKALSSYQQWNIIAANCASLDVGRNLGQCRRKWDSLLSEYYNIRLWQESNHGRGGGGGGGGGSYWCMKSERVRKNRLPETFDWELYKAIDELVKAREERGEVEIESDDPESGNDALDVTVEIGSKRKRRQSKSERHHGDKPRKYISEEQEYQKGCVEHRHEENHEEEEPEKNDLGEEYLKDFLEEKSKLKSRTERPTKNLPKEELNENNSIEESKSSGEEKETFSKEEKEETMALKLQELAVKIQAIGAESLEYDAAETKNNVEEYHAEFTRSQGDKIIESMGNFADTLKQLCGLLQDCK
ncbi:hypothetical protein Lal_00012567 [Lupinus albus]|uniref:Putative transcription factor MYB family n=1 Tax=Lupinus albus TaxID=3870 RepID=A0A6A4NHR4_LUPAL|nr:putative transcription factor MYB family [Lupinus albus]KAF1883650.1 hypothetical protein Lal_00012567 [Lupinus albus]